MSVTSRYIEKRLRYFEETNRFTMDTLELATSLGDYRQSVNRLGTVYPILDETESKVLELIPFEAITFYLVNEENNDFEHSQTSPITISDFVVGEVECLIETGVFAWALREKRPVLVSSRFKGRRFVLQAIATRSRTRGMFIGLLPEGTIVSDIKLSLLSLLLSTAAGTLESFYLYKMLRAQRSQLARTSPYRTLFEGASEGMELISGRGRITDCNETLCAMLGRKRNDIIGRSRTHFFSGDSRDKLKRLVPLLKKEGVAEAELELVSAGGDTVRVYRREEALYGEKKEYEGSVVFYRALPSK